jgi:hypothetical protein
MSEDKRSACDLEIPVLIHRLDRPVELLAQRLGEELLNGYVELLGEDDSETRIDVVLSQVSKRHVKDCLS